MKSIFYTLLFSTITYSVLFSQNINTIAGNGIAGFSGDGGPAIAAQIDYPKSICFDPSGNLYIADWSNHRIRKIDLSGNISTFAGNGTQAYTGDGGSAILASTSGVIHDIVSDNAGNIYFPDFYFHVVRKINTNGIISTIAGTGTSGHTGDGGLAKIATLNYPTGIAIDATGNIYIAEMDYIRKITPAGIITTIAGNINTTASGNGGPAVLANVFQPIGMAFDSKSNLIFADQGHNQIRKITPTGIISAFAGTGSIGYNGDGGLATLAEFNNPHDITFDVNGNLFIGDYMNNVIRMVDTVGIIHTIAGNGFNAGTSNGSFSGDGGLPLFAGFYYPTSVAFDGNGKLYICDNGNSRIRKVNTEVGINELLNNCNISIYPNPTNDIIIVSNLFPKNQSSLTPDSDKINIYDNLGELVLSSEITTTNLQLDLTNFTSGIYYLKTSSISKKIIKL